MHKESFAAIVQLRFDQVTLDGTCLDRNLRLNFKNLILNPSTETLGNLKFSELYTAMISTGEATESQMTLEYLKDVSSFSYDICKLNET